MSTCQWCGHETERKLSSGDFCVFQRRTEEPLCDCKFCLYVWDRWDSKRGEWVGALLILGASFTLLGGALVYILP